MHFKKSEQYLFYLFLYSKIVARDKVVHSGLQLLSFRASMPLHNYFYVQVYPRNKTDVDIRRSLYNFLFIRDTPVLDSLAMELEPATFRSQAPSYYQIDPPYPHVRRKASEMGRLLGITEKKLAPCRCLDGHVKEH